MRVGVLQSLACRLRGLQAQGCGDQGTNAPTLATSRIANRARAEFCADRPGRRLSRCCQTFGRLALSGRLCGHVKTRISLLEGG